MENGSLRSFQEKLNQSLLSDTTDTLLIGFFLSNTRWFIDLSHLKETSYIKAISKIGLVKPWILGITNIKGHIYTVVDMKKVIFDKQIDINQQNVVSIINDKYGLSLALLWEQSIGLINKEKLTKINLKKNPKFSLQAYQDEDSLIWCELDVTTLLTSDEITNIRAE